MRGSDLFDPLVWSDSFDIPPTHWLSATASSCTVQIFFIKYEVSLQLSSCSVQVCLSIGYLVRSMLQATVVVILKENKHVVIDGGFYDREHLQQMLFWQWILVQWFQQICEILPCSLVQFVCMWGISWLGFVVHIWSACIEPSTPHRDQW